MNDPSWRSMTRRQILHSLAAAGGCALLPSKLLASTFWQPKSGDLAFLDDLERQGCLFFWEQASEKTGQVRDRARNDLGGRRDPRRMASIAATGFGLTALCIADKRGYLPHAQIVERVRTTLDWHLNKFPEVRGFYYHFSDIESGEGVKGVELSSIDTSLLLCGVLTARAWFDDPKIKSLATQIYERVDWPWMLNDGKTFSMGWHPGEGFIDGRWEHFCELMMIYLLAIGSPTHPVPGEYWKNWTRPVIHYNGFTFISGNDPIFTHRTRTPGSISATSVTTTPTTSTTRSPQRRPTRRSASHIPSGTTRTTGAFPHRIIKRAIPLGEALRRRDPSMEPSFHARRPAHWLSFPPIASPFSVRCVTSGASRHGAVMDSWMRFIPPPTGMTPTCLGLIREFQF